MGSFERRYHAVSLYAANPVKVRDRDSRQKTQTSPVRTRAQECVWSPGRSGFRGFCLRRPEAPRRRWSNGPEARDADTRPAGAAAYGIGSDQPTSICARLQVFRNEVNDSSGKADGNPVVPEFLFTSRDDLLKTEMIF
jgi:hypothetical protein